MEGLQLIIMKSLGNNLELIEVDDTFIYKLMVEIGLIEFAKRSGAIIAGGCWRTLFDGSDLSDIDVFCSEPHFSIPIELGDDWEINYGSKQGGLLTISRTYKGLNLIIQFIHKKDYPTEAFELIEKFDMTACQFALKPSKLNYLICSAKAKGSATSKEVVLNNIQYPYRTLKRIFKYIKKGYSISNKELIKLIKKIKITNEDEDFYSGDLD